LTDGNSYIEFLIKKYRTKGIAIDTEILLLLCVGLFNEGLIKRKGFKRTDKYSVDEFRIAQGIIKQISPHIVTPHVLAEFSNFSNELKERRKGYYSAIDSFLKNELEIYYPKEEILDEPFISFLGFADISLYKTCRDEGCVLFTADSPLTGFLRRQNIDVINMVEIQAELWGL